MAAKNVTQMGGEGETGRSLGIKSQPALLNPRAPSSVKDPVSECKVERN